MFDVAGDLAPNLEPVGMLGTRTISAGASEVDPVF